MGGHPPHGKGPGGVPGPGGADFDGADPAATCRREVGVHHSSNGKGGGRFRDDRGVHSEKSEHGRAVHFYVIASVPVLGNIEDTGGMGGDVVVGAGGHRPSGGKGYGGSGGGRGRDIGFTEGGKGRLLGWGTNR